VRAPTEPLPLSARVASLHKEIRSSPPALCPERALLVTRYFRRHADPAEPAVLQRAGALSYILRRKQVRIYPRELLTGCFTTHRVGGGILPELHGVAMLEDLLRFERRPVNPLRISPETRRSLLTEVLPYWLPRFMVMRAMPLPRALRFVADQVSPTSYLINETGGISHFVPDYAALLARGTEGYRREIRGRIAGLKTGSEEESFLRAVVLVCDALEDFAAGYQREAARAAEREPDPERRAELELLAEVCDRVPRRPARTFQEALQSILFTQIALNLESMDNSVSLGRLDQVLYPYYCRDLEEGRADREGAFELLGCFALKLCEIVPVFSARTTRVHGGMFNGQVLVVGGVDEAGEDGTNELSFLFLDLMDKLRTRQPNYHARVHAGSPPEYRARVATVLASGAASPAVYNDEHVIPLLRSKGIALAHARDYANVGCVEPVVPGRSFESTDAALFNLPLCLELTLNEGRRFGRPGRRFQKRLRIGAPTPPAARCTGMDDLLGLLRVQIEHQVRRLLLDLGVIERANARLHPTPLSSLLLRGCIESARDASWGGATYNGSGIQAVGVVDVGDSLAAIEHVVFDQRRATMEELVAACRSNFKGRETLRAWLLKAPKYGNDDSHADGHLARAMELFAGTFEGRVNARGGRYVAGFYSVTAHAAFGSVVGALPSGRRAGEPFSSGLSPARGAERSGPTASLLSLARLPLHLAKNGSNYNLALAPWTVSGEEGARALEGLITGAFAAGCPQMQINVLDPAVLLEAKDNPGRYPGLIVRVSGYSAYFDDLSPEMKQEVIDRTLFETG